MSKIKRSLPEDIDITSPDEPDYSTSTDTQIGIGFSMFDIDKAITYLDVNKEAIYRVEADKVRAFASRLHDLASFIDQPSEVVPF